MASGTQIHKLKVADYMTDNPITIQFRATFPEAVTIMATKGIGNLIVTENRNVVVGLLTEREILQYLSLNREIPNKNIEYTALQSFSKISPDDTIYAAAKSMISNKTRLLVFEDNKNNRLAGIITASDIVRAFRKTDSNPPVEDVMSNKIFDLAYNNSILMAVKILRKRRIGSVIVTKDEKPYGIFTERDLLTKVLSKGVELDEKVGDYCTTPLITTQRGIRANEAANIMFTNNMKRLPLTQDGKIVSIVTARDLVEALQEEH
ncbi:MAG: CBS domain-containing protein [Nitrososphaeraceae archaeon]